MIRVIRVLEYQYTNRAAFDADRGRWNMDVNTVRQMNMKTLAIAITEETVLTDTDQEVSIEG